jgi:CRP-like cAMP-binding protein
MSSADMRIVLSECKIMQYRQDQVIFKAGQQEEDLFLLLEGAVQIFTGDSIGENYVLASGDVFGEEELCQKRRRTCTSLALSDSKIIVISRNIINLLSKKNPELMGQFFMNLGMRRTM